MEKETEKKNIFKEKMTKYWVEGIFPFLWAVIAVTTSMGALNYGDWFYPVMGVLNLIVSGYAIYKYIKTHEEK